MKITLKTLPKATEQEIFDQVAHHLLTQMERSEKLDICGKHFCRYRQGTLKCAAGALISDDEYRFGFEGSAWSGLVRTGSVPKEHMLFIEDLQRIHDQTSVKEWKSALQGFAKRHNLQQEF